jgi:hypothetical protein
MAAPEVGRKQILNLEMSKHWHNGHGARARHAYEERQML